MGIRWGSVGDPLVDHWGQSPRSVPHWKVPNTAPMGGTEHRGTPSWRGAFSWGRRGCPLGGYSGWGLWGWAAHPWPPAPASSCGPTCCGSSQPAALPSPADGDGTGCGVGLWGCGAEGCGVGWGGGHSPAALGTASPLRGPQAGGCSRGWGRRWPWGGCRAGGDSAAPQVALKALPRPTAPQPHSPTWADWEIFRVFFFSAFSSSPSRAFSTIHSHASIAFRDSLMGQR